MNLLQQLVVILPCHTLEDFPIRHDEQNAESLLANWTVLWHPALIATAQSMPQWVSSDFITIDFEQALILAPITCADNIPLEVSDAVAAGHAQLVVGLGDRQSILDEDCVSPWIAECPETDLVNDFFALGYAYLQVQLMTRQLRYSSSIDVTEFSQTLVAAASALTAGDFRAAQRQLQACFDLVAQERSSYYPTEPSLLELVLLTETTLGQSLNKQLNSVHPSNWLLSGKLLKLLEQNNVAAFRGLLEQVKKGQISIAGGSQLEMPANLVALESMTHQLAIGLRQFESNDIEIETFASRNFNVGPHLPQLLTQFEFRSSIHATFSGGDIPTDCAPIMNWQGNDGTNLPALAVTPLDAGSARSFLGLSIRIGEILDGHHHCPMLLVHWPERTSEYFNDLERVLKYAPVFGHFSTLASFNETLYDNGFSEAYEPDNYRFPWLITAAQQEPGNPISRCSAYWRCYRQIEAVQNALAILAILESQSDFSNELRQISELQRRNEESVVVGDTDNDLEKQLREICESTTPLKLAGDLTDEVGVVLNPVSSRCLCEVRDDEDDEDRLGQVIEIEAFGFETIGSKAFAIGASDPDVVIEDPDSGLPLLRNDFFEVRFDPATGGVRSVNRHGKKGNLFSQHIAIRNSKTVHQHGFPREQFKYIKALAEQFEITDQGKSSATVSSTAILLDDAESTELARVVQAVKLRRRSRVLEFSVNVEQLSGLSGPPWNNYLATRMAFPDKELRWRRSDHEIAVPIRRDRIVAPQFVEVVQPGTSKVTMLPGGLPFHRCIGERILDTLLIVAGESQREFEFAVAIDSPTSAAAAKSYPAPLIALPTETKYFNRSGWIFSANCQNVVITYLCPKFDQSGRSNGAILRMIETEKRSGELKLRFPFNLTSAGRTNFLGDKLNDLDFEGDQVTCNYCEHQYFQLECCW